MRVEHADVCGYVALSQCLSRLQALGYQETWAPLETGQYAYSITDAAPGWQDNYYSLSVAMRDGDVLAEILRGI
jgi:hypothetical protein